MDMPLQAAVKQNEHTLIRAALETSRSRLEAAEKLGISTSGLNYCLKALIDKGWVKVQNFSQSKNKFGYIYVLTPQGIAEKAVLTGRFLKRKMQEYESLRAEIEALQSDVEKPVSL